MAVNWWKSRRNRQLQNALVLNGGFRLIFRVPEYSELSIVAMSGADENRSAELLSSEYSCQAIWPQQWKRWMIERYFPQASVLIRLRSGPIGPYLPRFVSALEQRRLSQNTICRYAWFFVDAEHQRVLGRIQVEADHIGRLATKLRIGAHAPTLSALKM